MGDAFFFACRGGKEDAVRQFLAEGVDPNTMHSQGFPSLFAAAEQGRTAVIELLLALHARCIPPLPLDAWVQRHLAAAPPRRPSKTETPPPPGRNSASGGGSGAPGGGSDGAAPTEPKKRLLPGGRAPRPRGPLHAAPVLPLRVARVHARRRDDAARAARRSPGGPPAP